MLLAFRRDGTIFILDSINFVMNWIDIRLMEEFIFCLVGYTTQYFEIMYIFRYNLEYEVVGNSIFRGSSDITILKKRIKYFVNVFIYEQPRFLIEISRQSEGIVCNLTFLGCIGYSLM